MKRSLDLLRKMLLLIEDCPEVPPKTLRLDSFLDLNSNPAVISLHLELLKEAGFIEAQVISVDNGVKNFEVLRLTFAGYEYLESVRDNRVWRDVKQKVSAVGGATLEIVKNLAEAELTKVLQLQN